MRKVVADSTELAADDVAEGCEADTAIVLPDAEPEITSPGTGSNFLASRTTNADQTEIKMINQRVII